MSRNSLVGREAELRRLVALLVDAKQGRGALAVVEGGAGLGKTALLDACCEFGAGLGMRVLRACASELERGFAYAVVRQLLPIEPTTAIRADAHDAADADYRLIDAQYGVLRRVIGADAALVAIDDAGLADAPSLQWLAYVVKRVELLSVLVVVGRGLARPPGGDALLDDVIASAHRPVVVPVRPLSLPASAQLVRRELGLGATDAFCAACHTACRGHPFLLRELVKALSDDGLAADDTNAWKVSHVAPLSVSRAVLRQVERVSGEALALVEAVAVLGDGADTLQAIELAHLDELAALDAVYELARVRVLRREGAGLAFVQPVVGAAINAALTPRRRALAHREAARILHRDHARASEVAAHLLEFPPGGDAWALERLQEIATQALESGDRDLAASCLRRALEESSSPELRASLLVRLGALELHSAPDRGIAHLRDADELTRDPGLRAIVVERRACLRGPEDDAVGDRPEVARALAAAQAVAAASGGDGVRRPELVEAIPVAHRRFLDHLDTRMLAIVCNGLCWQEDLRPALALCNDAHDGARRIGSRSLAIVAAGLRTQPALRLGLLEQAETAAREARDGALGEAWACWLMPGVTAALACALVEEDRIDEAQDLLSDESTRLRAGEVFSAAMLLHARGVLLLAQGRHGEAAADLLECGRRLEAANVRNPAVLPWRSDAATALTLLGEPELARDLVERDIARARAAHLSRALGTALRAAGRLHRRGGDVALLREAVNAHERSVDVLERARSLADLGSALSRHGLRAQARVPLREASRLAEGCGAIALKRSAQAELVAAGGKPRARALSGLEALTGSERRVAELARQGLTNREIASTLFVSCKTVEAHLHRTYAKLAIHSRAQLEYALTRPTQPDGTVEPMSRSASVP